ncbi:MAG: hypothetical protein IJ941_02920, partial [Clostridia bacterium]|nr:hypothetical protein [Clostridia bacterium]
EERRIKNLPSEKNAQSKSKTKTSRFGSFLYYFDYLGRLKVKGGQRYDEEKDGMADNSHRYSGADSRDFAAV